MYQFKESHYNLSKILRIAPLKDELRFWYRELPNGRPEKRWFFNLFVWQKALAPGFYREPFLEDDYEPVTREQAVYDGRYVRVWYDPDNVRAWNMGDDLKFDTEEEANAFIEAAKKAASGCNFNPTA